MGSIEDDGSDDTTVEASSLGVDNSETETEFMDTLSSPLALDGSGSFTVPLEDDETQMVCLAGETQLCDFNNATQAVDDLDFPEDLCTTQVVIDTDDEETKKTEVLSDTEALSDVDSVRKVGNNPVEQENIQQTSMTKQSDGKLKSNPITEERNTGPILGGFTTLRVASIRSAGLAARNMALRRTNYTSCSIHSDSQHKAEHSGTSVIKDLYNFDQRDNLEEHDDQMKGCTTESKCRAVKSAARKLFNKDVSHENGQDKHNDSTEALPLVFTFENELAGLSYVDSQEPGEASQNNALDFVDKFLKLNATDFDQEAEFVKSTGGKSKPLSGAKGTQSLAKRVGRICSASGGIYDWDDNHEDEGGGDFFRKRKEAFYDNGYEGKRSFTQPRNLKRVNLKNSCAIKGTAGTEEQEGIIKNVSNSDSNLLLNKSKKNNKAMEVVGKSVGKNLIKELNDARDEMVETGTRKDNLDMMGVGTDTQLAVEAMEALSCGVGVNNYKSNIANQDTENHMSCSVKGEPRKKSHQGSVKKKASYKSEVITKPFAQAKRSSPELAKGSSNLSEQLSVKTRKQRNETADRCNLRCELIDEKVNETELATGYVNETERRPHASTGQKTVQKRRLQEHFGTPSPIAFRTRQKAFKQTQGVADPSTDSREEMNSLTDSIAPKRKKRSALDALSTQKRRKITYRQTGALKDTKETLIEQSHLKFSGNSTVQEEKDCQNLSGEEINGDLNVKFKVSQVNLGIKKRTRSSVVHNPALASLDRQSGKGLANDTSVVHNHNDQNGNATSKVLLTTPIRCTIPVSEASPICMGDEYNKQSCRKNLLRSPLKRNSGRTIADRLESPYSCNNLRKRRDVNQLKVLFSQHLDEDTTKQQKKVLARLGVSVASSISDATHFVADEFVRTRNMLEAIANGKPVVTRFWLESCGQASCLLDERNYILRDAKKEKEMGFSLPVSLARACQHPLLQGCKVFITNNTKPGKDILANLVKAVQGVAVERIGRSALKDEKIPGDLIILSCEDDYADCVPFLKKGASVYSSELLLNGIVIQKLEYERYRLFADNVKKTRSTIWLKKEGQFISVAKCK